MSHIFDALQRSEAESSGADLPRLLEATELLKRAERRATSQWEAETEVETRVAAPILRPDATRFGSYERTSAATLVMPAGPPPAEPVPAEPSDRPDPLFDRFRSLLVPLAAKNRLLCLTDTNSVAAEAFRLLGVRLRHLRRERPLGKVLITSTIPQEGKSTVAANLACTLTSRQRTLLVEGDVRRPSLSHVFGLEGKPGLCDWLRGERDATECIYHLDGPGFWILPAGNAAGNPLEMLQSGRLSTVMEQLAGWFHWIVIDTPPVLPLADTSVWARHADGILLVVRQGTTEKRQLQKGLEALEPQKLIGALLNSSTTAANSGYYYSSTEPRPDEGSTL
jgi:capsular exopolysaccharide synthesis family protein